MNLFERIPSDLFSPLASPNRKLYADALDVLYTAYQEALKIPENTLYSMLRSKLEHQLAEASFEGEDIDEEELRDISGRARFLIRKLCAKGWFEKERGEDFEEYITVPGYSSRILELLHSEYGRAAIAAYVMDWLGSEGHCFSKDLGLRDDKDYIMSLLAVLASGENHAAHEIHELGGLFTENGYTIPQMEIIRKEKKK